MVEKQFYTRLIIQEKDNITINGCCFFLVTVDVTVTKTTNVRLYDQQYFVNINVTSRNGAMQLTRAYETQSTHMDTGEG